MYAQVGEDGHRVIYCNEHSARHNGKQRSRDVTAHVELISTIYTSPDVVRRCFPGLATATIETWLQQHNTDRINAVTDQKQNHTMCVS